MRRTAALKESAASIIELAQKANTNLKTALRM